MNYDLFYLYIIQYHIEALDFQEIVHTRMAMCFSNNKQIYP